MRTFIAIELTPEPQAALVALQGQLKRVISAQWIRWTVVQNLHLTLHFLGEIEPNQVAPITAAMQASGAAMSPFTLHIAQLGCFPNLTRPQVVLVGVTGTLAPLQQLQQDLGQRLQATIGFQPETRPYMPHLTLGRVRDQVAPSDLRQLGQAVESFKIGVVAELTVTAMTFMQSELRPNGPIYTPLAHGTLHG